MSDTIVAAAPNVTWRVVPVRTPYAIRHCPHCNAQREFVSSDRFRVNASGRKLDVWLIYRCVVCDFTWNLTVVERATPQFIGVERLRAFTDNDATAAWSCAFDAGLLKRSGTRMEPTTPVVVERPSLPIGGALLRFALPFPVHVRLDCLLARELGVARSSIARCVASKRDLRRPVFDGQTVRLEALPPAPRRGGAVSPPAASEGPFTGGREAPVST